MLPTHSVFVASFKTHTHIRVHRTVMQPQLGLLCRTNVMYSTATLCAVISGNDFGTSTVWFDRTY